MKLVDMSRPHMRRLMLATDIVCTLLGYPWYRDHASQEATSRYLRSKPQSPEDARRFYFRLVRLAEALFFLQDAPGFADRLVRWRRMTVEALVAELEGARLVAHADIPFEFREETGSRGNDFDLNIWLDGTLYAGELKGKVEATEFSAATLLKTMKRARQQIAKGTRGLVWIRVPEVWGTSPAIEPTCLWAVGRLFSLTERIVGVIIHWEQLDAAANDDALFSIRSLKYANPRHEGTTGAATALLERLFLKRREAVSIYDFPCRP